MDKRIREQTLVLHPLAPEEPLLPSIRCLPWQYYQDARAARAFTIQPSATPGVIYGRFHMKELSCPPFGLRSDLTLPGYVK